MTSGYPLSHNVGEGEREDNTMQVQVTYTDGHKATVAYKSLPVEVQELLCPDKPRIVEDGVTYDLIESLQSTPCQVDTHRVTLDSQATEEKQMIATTATATRTISHPQLQYLATADFGVLPSDLSFLDVPESKIAKMSHDELEDAVLFLDEGGFPHTSAWHKLYAQYRNDAYLASRGVTVTQPTTTTEKKQMIATDNALATQIDNLTHAEITATPEVLAATDVRTLDVIENLLLNQKFNAVMTDDLVLTIQEYMKAPNSTTQAALALLADTSKLRGVFKLVKQIQNSPEFQGLVAENTPDESPIPTPKQAVVATGTTAKAVASKSKPAKGKSKALKHVEAVIGEATDCPQDIIKPAKATKTPKVKPVTPMPVIASLEALEAMSRPELAKAIQALNCNISTSTRANGSNSLMMETLATHVLKIVGYKAPEKQKPAKTPKAPKVKKQEPVIELPEGLSWDEVKGMKYRALQQLGKAFRSQGYTMPRLNSKGDDIKTAIADAMRKMGHDIQEVAYTPQSTKELHLPNLAQARESQRLDREVTKALKLSNEEAQVALQMAVAA